MLILGQRYYDDVGTTLTRGYQTVHGAFLCREVSKVCMSSHSAPTMPNLIRKWLSVTSLKLQLYPGVQESLVGRHWSAISSANVAHCLPH